MPRVYEQQPWILFFISITYIADHTFWWHSLNRMGIGWT